MLSLLRAPLEIVVATGLVTRGRSDASRDDLRGVKAVVTGGSRGIGRAIVANLARRGAAVMVGCRSGAEPLRGHDGRIDREVVDVSSVASVRRFAGRIASRWSHVDILVNNAGASFRSRLTSVDGDELTFATNALGSFFVTASLLPLLRRSARARVVHVGSMGQYFARLRTDELVRPRGVYLHEAVYLHSKRAQFELSEAWAARLADDNITSTCAHPGLVDTPGVAKAFPRYHLVASSLLRSPEEGADTAVWLATSSETGGFWFDRKRQPSDLVSWTRTSAAERDRLWRACVSRWGAEP